MARHVARDHPVACLSRLGKMMMGHGHPVLAGLTAAVTATLCTDVDVTVPADMFTHPRAGYASAW